MSIINKVKCDLCDTEVDPQEIDITYYRNVDDKMEMYNGYKADARIVHRHICRTCILQLKELDSTL